MKRLRNFLLYALLFVVALMILTPKVNLYYLFEEQMAPYGVVVDGEQLKDRGLCLEIGDATLYAKGIDSATAERISVKLFGLYNRIAVENTQLATAFTKFFPSEITHIEVTHAVWNPTNVIVNATGDFGSANAVISLLERSVTARVTPSELMKKRFGSTLRKLKKDETGGYRYETRF
ncbi:MAG: hypothetical protein R3302_01700 [Sulfurimonadaceae bacterium]|nr:hypothetical protein [Sulfurimonadaceae bacterium]